MEQIRKVIWTQTGLKQAFHGEVLLVHVYRRKWSSQRCLETWSQWYLKWEPHPTWQPLLEGDSTNKDTHTLIKDKRMYPKLLDKFEPLKHICRCGQIWFVWKLHYFGRHWSKASFTACLKTLAILHRRRNKYRWVWKRAPSYVWRWKILHSGNSSVSYSDIMKPNPPLKNPSNKIRLASEEIETNTSLWSGVRLHKILFNVLQFNLNTIRSAAWQFDCGMTNNRAYNRAALIEDGLLPLLQKSEVWLGLGSMIVSNPFPFCAFVLWEIIK